jgi:hypothetical protein
LLRTATDALIARAAAHITRKASGNLPSFRDQVDFVLREDTDDAVADQQRTRALKSQAYSRKHSVVDTMSSDELLRDASKRMVGSKSSVDIYRDTRAKQMKITLGDFVTADDIRSVAVKLWRSWAR